MIKRAGLRGYNDLADFGKLPRAESAVPGRKIKKGPQLRQTDEDVTLILTTALYSVSQ